MTTKVFGVIWLTKLHNSFFAIVRVFISRNPKFSHFCKHHKSGSNHASIRVPPECPALLEDVSSVVDPVRQVGVQEVLECVTLVVWVGIEGHVTWDEELVSEECECKNSRILWDMQFRLFGLVIFQNLLPCCPPRAKDSLIYRWIPTAKGFKLLWRAGHTPWDLSSRKFAMFLTAPKGIAVVNYCMYVPMVFYAILG